MASKISTLIETEFQEKGADKTVNSVERLQSAESRLASTNRKLAASNGSLVKSFGKLKLGIAAAAAAVVAGAFAFSRMMGSTLDMADKIAKSADKIGVSTNALQEYRYAAGLAGVESNKLDDALGKFSKNMGELGRSSSATQTALKDLDPVLLTMLKNTSGVNAQLKIAFRGLKDIEDPAKRSAIAVALFGRSGQDLLNMVNNVDDLTKKARSLGLVIEERLLRSAEKANDAMSTLAQVLKTRVAVAMLELAPRIEQLANKLITHLPKIFDLIDKTGKLLGLWDTSPAERLLEITKEISQLQNKLMMTNGGAIPNGGSLFQFFDPYSIKKKIAALEEEREALKKLVNETTKLPPVGGPKNVEVRPYSGITDIWSLKQKYQDSWKDIPEIKDIQILHKKRLAELDELSAKIVAKKSPLENFAEEVSDYGTQMSETWVNGFRGMEDGLLDFIEGTKTAGEAVADMAKGIVRDINRMLIRKLITEPILGAMGFANGGTVGNYAGGGSIPSMASGGLRDRVPAMLEPGEFVIRKPMVSRIGESNLRSLNAHGKMGNGSPNISFNMVNETGQPLEAKQKSPMAFDGEKWVIDTVIKNYKSNGPLRTTLRGGKI